MAGTGGVAQGLLRVENLQHAPLLPVGVVQHGVKRREKCRSSCARDGHTLLAQSHGLFLPHSQTLKTMGRPAACSASRIVA